MERDNSIHPINDLLGENGNTQLDAPKDELDQLLGSSDEESEHEQKGKEDELNDLLGDSDGEEETTLEVLDSVNVEPEVSARFDELEQILGKMDAPKSSLKDQRTKTTSKFVLPESYKVPNGHKSLFVRTPNFIKIQSYEYDEPLYTGESERIAFDGSTAIVRWRTKRDSNGEIVLDASGQPVKESNARMIQWADGSVQLIVGDAVFQCKSVDVDNCYVYEQQHVQLLEGAENNNNVLECIGGIQQRLVLQPTSLDSESHARMSLKISEKHKKESKIGIRDYEQIKERPEETLAKIAREEEEAMRRERKIRQQREYASGSAVNTITGAARYVRRPTMSAEYLAAGGFDDEDGDGEVGDNHEPDYYGRERRQPPQKPKAAPKAKAPKRKVAAPSDYLEYDEEEGSEADEDEEEDGEDGSEMEDDVDDDDEEEDEEEEESGEESEEEEEDGDASGDSDVGGEAVVRGKSKGKDKDKGGDKDKAGKRDKKSKKDKKERRRLKEERRRVRKEKRREQRSAKPKPAEGRKTKRPASDDESEGTANRAAASVADKAVAGAGGAPGQDDDGVDEEMEMNMQQRKRIKRTIIDSDEDE